MICLNKLSLDLMLGYLTSGLSALRQHTRIGRQPCSHAAHSATHWLTGGLGSRQALFRTASMQACWVMQMITHLKAAVTGVQCRDQPICILLGSQGLCNSLSHPRSHCLHFLQCPRQVGQSEAWRDCHAAQDCAASSEGTAIFCWTA